MILAGDVGGTKVQLALYSFDGGRLKVVRERRFPAHEFASLDAAVKTCAESNRRIAEMEAAHRKK